MADHDFIRPPPAYQEYASDLLANLQFRAMTLPERGLFCTLRLELWTNQTLPAELDELSRLLGIPKAEIQQALTSRVRSFFEISDESMRCPELDRYRAKLLQQRKKQSEGGAIGGKKTQERMRSAENPYEGKGGLQGSPKVLSKGEVSRREGEGVESSEDEQARGMLPASPRAWVDDYEAHEKKL
jgi:hypothetical protein